jgi:hypothetical protein
LTWIDPALADKFGVTNVAFCGALLNEYAIVLGCVEDATCEDCVVAWVGHHLRLAAIIDP